MLSTNNSWHLLHKQLMDIQNSIIPTAPYQINEKFMKNIIYENHWIEFDTDILIDDKIKNKISSTISVNEINHLIVVTNISNTNNNTLHLFDIIISFNDINFRNITKETAQCIINAHQGKIIKIRIRRLQPSNIETIEFNLPKTSFINSPELGFTIDGGINKTNNNNNKNNDDPGLFIIGIKPNGQAANNGRLQIGDRLIQISNTYMTINLQCIQFDTALKLIKRIRNESTSISLIVAHQTQD